LLPLARDWDALVAFGIITELIGGLWWSSVFVGDIFMEVAAQESVQRGKVGGRDFRFSGH
jgi:hypothetical protein